MAYKQAFKCKLSTIYLDLLDAHQPIGLLGIKKDTLCKVSFQIVDNQKLSLFCLLLLQSRHQPRRQQRLF